MKLFGLTGAAPTENSGNLKVWKTGEEKASVNLEKVSLSPINEAAMEVSGMVPPIGLFDFKISD